MVTPKLGIFAELTAISHQYFIVRPAYRHLNGLHAEKERNGPIIPFQAMPTVEIQRNTPPIGTPQRPAGSVFD